MLFSCSPKEAFPLLRRLLYDSFQVDAWIFSWPYQDLDRIDNSIRRTLWGEYFHTPVEFQDFWENFPSHNIIILKSSLGFCNIICLLSSESHPDFISIGPFREHEMTPSFLSRTARENHLSGKSFTLMQNFYRIMPMADPESLASFLSHFLGALLPDYDKVPPVHVSFSETVRKIISDHELLLSENADHAERYADRYRQTIDALVSGDLDTALHALRSWLSLSVLPEESHTGQFRRYLTVINELFASALLSCPIHPVYIREIAHEVQTQIDSTENYEILCGLPAKILRKYCLLVRNESYAGCSSLIRQVIDYIRIHLSEDLSLTGIAREFHRHPSSLSAFFRKETGRTLTSFICQSRIQKAVYALNTSSLEIREIASSVGFHDLGYFSRVFRSQMGMSPSEYRKMFFHTQKQTETKHL